ncbi:MAG: glycoside hydrolase family 5 [Bacilli bacterium]|nr:glycoside hydrolase family 5 [Bacilli bacterium]
MIHKKVRLIWLISLLSIITLGCSNSTLTSAQRDISPQNLMQKMTLGINLGNTLDAPNEGEWSHNLKAQPYYFDDFKKEGFTFVRIPIQWGSHTEKTAPYTIDKAWLDRVQQVVDWSLSRGFITMIDTHHEDWLMQDYQGNVARLDAIWTQIAERFKNEPTTLVFEIFNEPHFNMTLTDTDDMNQRELRIIRSTNPTRNVVISGTMSSSITKITIPKDNHLIATFHYYNPLNFTENKGETWGTDKDIQTVKGDFGHIKQWSEQNNIPVLMGEFGVVDSVPAEQRVLWIQTVVQDAQKNGFAYAYWNDAGQYAIYNRVDRTWDANVLNVLKNLSR